MPIRSGVRCQYRDASHEGPLGDNSCRFAISPEAPTSVLYYMVHLVRVERLQHFLVRALARAAGFESNRASHPELNRVGGQIRAEREQYGLTFCNVSRSAGNIVLELL